MEDFLKFLSNFDGYKLSQEEFLKFLQFEVIEYIIANPSAKGYLILADLQRSLVSVSETIQCYKESIRLSAPDYIMPYFAITEFIAQLPDDLTSDIINIGIEYGLHLLTLPMSPFKKHYVNILLKTLHIRNKQYKEAIYYHCQLTSVPSKIFLNELTIQDIIWLRKRLSRNNFKTSFESMSEILDSREACMREIVEFGLRPNGPIYHEARESFLKNDYSFR